MQNQSWALLAAATVAAAVGQLLFRIAALGRQGPAEFVNLPIMAGLMLYAAGTAIWIFVLSRERVW